MVARMIARWTYVSWILAAVVLPAEIFAQQRALQGRVVSEDGVGLQHARVELATGPGAWALTDAEGSFRLDGLPSGAIALLVTRPGYRTVEFSVGEDEGTSLVVRLPIDPVSIPGIDVVGLRSELVGKRSEPILITPQSVTLVDRRVVEGQGGRDLGDVVRNVAGIIQSDGRAGPGGLFSLRGFYSDNNGNFRKNGALVLKTAELLQPNVERVEVLKGPSSVFFGQLDPGGVVNLVTKRPQSVFQSSVDLRSGSFGLLEGTADVTGPISEGGTSYRVIASARRGGEFIGVDRDQLFLAPSIRLASASRGVLELDVELSRGEGVTNPGLKAPAETFEGLEELPADRFLGEDGATYDRRQASVQLSSRLNVTSNVQARSLVSISTYDWSETETALRDFQADARTLNRRAERTEIEQDDLHLDLFLLGGFDLGSSRHETTVGADFQSTAFGRDRFRRDMDPVDVYAPVQTGMPSALDPLDSGTTDTDVLGAYLSHTVELGPMRLLGGVRRTSYSQESQTGDVLEADDWTANAGVVVRVGPSGSLFGTFTESFAPTLFTSGGVLFDPSFGRQFEVGAKLSLADGRALATVSLFDLENSGVLSFFRDQNGDFQVEQGGVHGSRGVELEVNGRVVDRLFVLASYAYLQAEVRDDVAYPAGTPLGGSPEHAGSVWLDFQATSRLAVGGGVFRVDERKAFLSSEQFMPAHTLLDASVTFQLTPAVTLRAVGRNLTDARHYLGGSGTFGRPGPTRSVVVEAKALLR